MAFISTISLSFRSTTTSRQAICRRSTSFIPTSTLKPRSSSTILSEFSTPFISHSRQQSTITMLKEGDKAPMFSAEDTDGNTVSMEGLKGSKVVLYFSNGAGPGCTSQSCSFRDAEAQFQTLDAKIIAVTAQNKAASISFKESNGLKFTVIPDKEGSLQKLFGVPATFGLIPGRITFVIDREGIIRSAYNSQFSASSHVKVAKEAVQKLD